MARLGGSDLSDALINRAVQTSLGPLLESTRTLVVLVDSRGQFVASNPAFLQMRGGATGAVSILDLVPPAHKGELEQLLGTARSSGQAERGRLEFGSPDKSIACDCLIVPAERGAVLILAEPTQADFDLLAANERLSDELDAAQLAFKNKVAELEAVVAQADELAHTDTLTLLPNRRAIIADLQRQVTYAERYATPLAISMIDLDGFKAINDASGHPAGDKILGIVARDLRDRIRLPDEIGRYGGDEFLVVLPNSTAVAASDQATRLCQHVRSTPIAFAEARMVRLSLSAGITQFKRGDDDWHSLLERADRALYEAKRLGGDRWLILES